MLRIVPVNDSCGTGATKPDSGERKATQTASTTKYTGAEVGDERNFDESPKMSDSGKFWLRGPGSSNFLSLLAKIPLVTKTNYVAIYAS
jgi:hypothetical protein